MQLANAGSEIHFHRYVVTASERIIKSWRGGTLGVGHARVIADDFGILVEQVVDTATHCDSIRECITAERGEVVITVCALHRCGLVGRIRCTLDFRQEVVPQAYTPG